MMKCEYRECKEKAYKKFLSISWLCKKHYLIVRDSLAPINAGRPKGIDVFSIFNFLENRADNRLSIREFMKVFDITFPTAQTYLKALERHRFIKSMGNGSWMIIKKS